MIEKQIQFSRFLSQLFSWMVEQNIEWVLGDAWRSTDKLQCAHCGWEHSYQELLVYNKRSKQLKSKNNDRLAQDIIIIKDGKPTWVGEPYRAMGEQWEKITQGQGRWGGRFGLTPDKYTSAIGWDPGHLELL